MARQFAAVLAVTLSLVFLSPAGAAVPALRQPAWAELTPEQKQILAPLAGEWNALEVYRQKKWLGIAQRYPTLTPDEQARMQRRMTDWVKLSPEQRKAAREKYKSLKTAPPERKEVLRQKWQEYKELPEEERLRLQEQAARTRPAARPGKAVKTPLTPSSPIPPATPTPPAAPATTPDRAAETAAAAAPVQ